MACLLGNERSLVRLKESILEEAMEEPVGRGRPASFRASWRWLRRAGLIPSAADDPEGWTESAVEVCVYEVHSGCFLRVCACACSITHSGLTLCDPMDDSPSMGFPGQEDKARTNLDSILNSRDITLPTKIHLVKALVFPVVVYECESWTIKAECRRINAFEL